MVKLKGPMQSLDATGSLAGVLVYAKSGGVSYARKLTIPKQPTPLLQRAGRALTSFLSKEYAKLIPAHRATWEDATDTPGVDGYRRFISYNLTRFGLQKPPTKLYPSPEMWGWPTIAVWTIQGKNRRANHGLTATATSDQWGVFISRHTSDFNDADLTHLQRVVPIDLGATYEWWDSPLAADTYYYRIRPFSNGGNMRTWSTLKTVVIPG